MREKKGTRDQKTVFASFEFCFFRGPQTVNRPSAWAHMTAMHSFIVCNGEGNGGGGGERYSKRSALCVCRHNQKYFECFLCKVRRFFFLSLLPDCDCVVFRLSFSQYDAELGERLQQFLGLVSTTPDRVLLIFEAHFWARHGKLRAKSCG